MVKGQGNEGLSVNKHGIILRALERVSGICINFLNGPFCPEAKEM